MPLAASIEFPRADVDALFRQIDRAQKDLGKSMARSVSWAAAYVARSLSAATKVAPKLRPLVENPDKRYKTDLRRARVGVYVYRKGVKKFVPIYRTGEYGTQRFVGKTKREGTLHASAFHAPNDGFYAASSAQTHRKREIGRRGLAKKTWQLAASFAGRGGYIKPMGVYRLAGAVRIIDDAVNPGVVITNHLDYAMEAFKTSGEQAISSALARASRNMEREIDRQIKKKLGAK